MKTLLSLSLLVLLPALVWGQVAPTHTVARAEMEQVLHRYLLQRSQQLPNVELRFKTMSLPKPFTVPAGNIVHDVIAAKSKLGGSQRLTMVTRVDGRTVSNRTMRVTVEAMAEVVVSSGSIRRGTLIGMENIELQYLNISRVKDPIFSADEVVGRMAKRSVRNGDVMQKNQVEFPPLIKRGERVVIRASGRGLTLTAAGEARQDGRPGQSIRVLNSNSSKEVLCKVIAPGLVAVEF